MKKSGFYLNKSLNMVCYGFQNENSLSVNATVILTDFRFGFNLGYHYPRWEDLTYICSKKDLSSLDNFLSFINESDSDRLIDYTKMKKLIKLAIKNSKQIDDYSNCLIMDNDYEVYFQK